MRSMESLHVSGRTRVRWFTFMVVDAKAKKDVSPISFVSQDDPPVMQVHGDKDNTVPIKHARNLHERLKSVGVKTELVIIEGANHGVAGAAPQVAKQAGTFVREQLLRP